MDAFDKAQITYEVGIDESPHPDMTIADRLREIGMSDCKAGCKIYGDPMSRLKVVVHSRVYGCTKTRHKLYPSLSSSHA